MKSFLKKVMAAALAVIIGVSGYTVPAKAEDSPEVSAMASQAVVTVSETMQPYVYIKDTDGMYMTAHLDESYHYDDAPVRMDVNEQGQWQKFRLVHCSGTNTAVSYASDLNEGGTYALQQVETRRYLSFSGKCDDVFINDKDRIKFQPVSGANMFHIYFEKEEYKWFVSSDDNSLTFSNSEDDASFFTVTVEDEHTNTSMLQTGEMFNLDNEDETANHAGYWNIQDEVGKGETTSLESLGYTILKDRRHNKKVVEEGVMECAIGAKKSDSGYYDIIIAFQGTGGYPYTDDIFDLYYNIKHDIVDGQHVGYRDMAYKLINNQSYIGASVGGTQITLKQLLAEAKRGNAHFTLLGHSMGGAIAQCYALYLANKAGIAKSDITGRTFEPALAVTSNDDSFTDWLNICVDSDTVPNGTVPNSILYLSGGGSGIYRLGTTVWLTDPDPDLNHDNTYKVGVTDSLISPTKHNMDGVLKTLLEKYCVDTADINRQTSGMYVTIKANIESNYGPYANSGSATQFPELGTEMNVVSETTNKHGHLWYNLSDGTWIYGENLAKLNFTTIDATYQVVSNSAPVRNTCYSEGSIKENLKAGKQVTVTGVLTNTRKSKWYKVEYDGKTGWIYAAHLRSLTFKNSRLSNRTNSIAATSLKCPVDVFVYDMDHNLVASIENNIVTASNDESRVVPTVEGDEKILYLDGGEKFLLDIKATDDGLFEYLVEGNYDPAAGEYAEQKDFDQITLVQGKEMNSTVGGDITAPKTELYVLDDAGNKASEIQTSGLETETGSKDPAFEDVKASDWFFKSVKYSYNQGTMTGLSNILFGPGQDIGRGQFATILYRLEGEPETEYTTQFPDVPDGPFYTKPCLWAYGAGIVSGYANGYMGPADSITREQMAAMMYRYANYKGYVTSGAGDLSSFPDHDSVSPFAKDAMEWAVSIGLITGDQGRLNPHGTANRAQCAAIIMRFMTYYGI